MNWDDPQARADLLDRVGSDAYNKALAAHRDASTIETVNGHAIRKVMSRFGEIFAVGHTGTAFSTLEAAKRYANRGRGAHP